MGLFGGVVDAEPFLHWMGGKRRLWTQMERHFPRAYRTYHEPFLGGGAVFLSLQPQRAIIGDALGAAADMWRAVKESPERLIAELETLKDDREIYLRGREEFNRGDASAVRRAALLIYFTHTCFGGQARFNRAGEFNTAYASPDHRPNRWRIPVDAIWAAHHSLIEATVNHEDFTAVLERAERGDLVYMDPPYDESPDSNYTGAGWTADDTRRLAEVCRILVERGAHVRVSNNDTPLVREAFADFDYVTVTRPGTFHNRGDERKPVEEVLIIGGGA